MKQIPIVGEPRSGDLERILRAAHELPIEDLPRLLGKLEEIRCTAMARLSSPILPNPQRDELLGIDQASARLGVSKDYLYRHSAEFSFTRRMGKRLLFSALGIERHIKQLR